MVLNHIPGELKDSEKIKKALIFKRILLEKIVIMHGKGESSLRISNYLKHFHKNCKYIQYFTNISNSQWIHFN